LPTRIKNLSVQKHFQRPTDAKMRT